MTECLKIIQISDLHIGFANENPYNIDVRGNFVKILSTLKSTEFDLLVISGDLCFRQSNKDIYHWIKEQLIDFNGKYVIVPGNHDDSQVIAKIFHCESNLIHDEIYFKKQLNNHPILFLDSSKGNFSASQLKWLEKELKGSNKGPVIIFMHHPPLVADVPYMDNKWAFESREEVETIFNAVNYEKYVFCGHYHLDKTIRKDHLSVYITPSTFFNLKADSKEFEIDNYLLGWRQIYVYKDRITTSVNYLNGESNS